MIIFTTSLDPDPLKQIFSVRDGSGATILAVVGCFNLARQWFDQVRGLLGQIWGQI
jgi:hypothetical protein